MSKLWCGLGGKKSQKQRRKSKGIPRDTPTSDNSLHLNGVTISVQPGDITQIGGDAVVTGEDWELSGKGGTSTALIEAGRKKYRRAREKLRKKLENETDRRQRVHKTKAGKLPVSEVLHAMTPLYKHDQENWYPAMRALNRDVISEAEDSMVKELVMPVLGSGRAGGPLHLAVSALLDAVKDYSPIEHLHFIILVDVDANHVSQIRRELLSRRRGGASQEDPFRGAAAAAAAASGGRNLSREETGAGGAAWGGAGGRHHDEYDDINNDKRRGWQRSRGSNWSETKGDNISYDHGRDKARRSWGHAPPYEAEDVLPSPSPPSQAQDRKAKRDTFPKMRKSRDEREFICEKSRPHIPDDFKTQPQTQQPAPAPAPAWQPPRPTSREFPQPPAQPHAREFPQSTRPEVQQERSKAYSHSPNRAMTPERPMALETPMTSERGMTSERAGPNGPRNSGDSRRAEAEDPRGKMTHSVKPNTSLPGHADCGTICIEYSFANGTQKEGDPRPGRPYKGVFKRAFLPDNSKGRQLLVLLEIAFHRGLLFHVEAGNSQIEEDFMTWRGIPHKTSMKGGKQDHGYPDPDYLRLLEKKLAQIGITQKQL